MAVGDESIGFGGTLEINDGGADAFVAVDMIVSLGIPDYEVGTVESKRLDLPGRTIVMLATLRKGSSFPIKIQHTHAGFARMKAIADAMEEKHFKFTVPDDDGDTEITIPGIVTSVKIDTLDPEKITEFEMTVQTSRAEL